MSDSFLRYKEGEAQRIQTFIYGLAGINLFAISAAADNERGSIIFFVSLMLAILAYYSWYRMEMLISEIIICREQNNADSSQKENALYPWQVGLHWLSFGSILLSTGLFLFGAFAAKFSAIYKFFHSYPDHITAMLFWTSLSILFVAILVVYICCARAENRADKL